MAWCPVASAAPFTLTSSGARCQPKYLLATAHQEIDSSFNSKSAIEILSASPSLGEPRTISSLGNCASRLPLSTLSWGQQTNPTSSCPLGLIAGGMEDGTVTLWNPYKLITSTSRLSKQALLGEYGKYHQHKITAMQFNPTVAQHTFLATADEAQKLFVWDLTNPSRPLAQQPPGGPASGSNSGYPQYATCVAWNHNVSYILAVSSFLGQTRIYDLRHKKVALTFESKQRGMDKAGAVSWSPLKARQLAVCYASGDAEVWDLKQPKSPKLRLPTQNVLDLSWSTLDKNLLLTAHTGAVGRLWNGNSAALMTEFEFFGNTVAQDFDGPQQIEWNNQRGGLVAALSGDKISIHVVNDCGENYTPKWLQRESGAAHAFGGRLVSFGIVKEAPSESSGGTKSKKSTVLPPRLKIESMPKSQAMMARAMQFKRTLKSLENADELRAFCETKLKSLQSLLDSMGSKANGVVKAPPKAKKKEKVKDDILADLGISDSDEEEVMEEIIEEAPVSVEVPSEGVDVNEVQQEIGVWRMIGLFFDGERYKDDLVRFLGFEKKEMVGLVEREKAKLAVQSRPSTSDLVEEVQTQRPKTPVVMEQPDESSDDDGSDFFNGLIGGDDEVESEKKAEKANGVDVSRVEKERDQKEESSVDQPVRAIPEQRVRRKATAEDESVRHAVITGNYEFAIDCALKQNKMADALLFAHYAQDDLLWEMVTRRYLDQHTNAFMADTFGFVAKKQFTELVAASSQDQWRQTLAILLSFTDGDELKSLCNALGQRLASINFIEGAVSCFLCSQNVAELVTLWTNPNPISSGAAQTKQPKKEDVVLHSAITKALVFVKAIEGRGEDKSGQEALSGVFCRYANLLANAGSTDTALSFLEFVAQLQQGGRQDRQINDLRDRITGRLSQTPPQSRQRGDSNRGVRNAEPLKERRPARPKTPGLPGQRGQPGPGQRAKRPIRPGPTRRPPPQQTRTQPQPRTQPAPIRRVSQQSQHPSQRREYGSMDPAPTQTVPPRANKMPQRGPRRPNQRAPRPGPAPVARTQPAPVTNPTTQPPPRRRGPSSSSMPLSPRGQRGPQRRSSQPQANPQPRTQPQSPNRSGMNGTAPGPSMPTRNRRGRGGGGRGGGGRGQIVNRQPQPQPKRVMPSTTQPQPQRQVQPQPITRQPQPQPTTQPLAQPARGPTRGPGLPARSRGRGRGQRRGPPGPRPGPVRSPAPVTRGPAPTQSPPRRRAMSNQNQQFEQPQPIEQMQPAAAAVEGYHPAAVSSGTGFFGQTALLEDDADAQPLPSDAAESVQGMKQWLDGLSQNEQVSGAVRKKLAMQSAKMSADVEALLSGNRLSHYAFSTLTGIFEALQSQRYDSGLKMITDFTKSCKNKKKEKFATHRKWVMALQAILRIAKQQGL